MADRPPFSDRLRSYLLDDALTRRFAAGVSLATTLALHRDLLDALALRAPPPEAVITEGIAAVHASTEALDRTALRRVQRALKPHWERWALAMDSQPGTAHYRLATLVAGAAACALTANDDRRRDAVIGALTGAEMAFAELGDGPAAWDPVRRVLARHLPGVVTDAGLDEHDR